MAFRNLNKTILMCALALSSAVTGTATDRETELWKHSSPVQVDRETARTQTISYNSEELARAGSHETSLYLQSLNGEWTTSSDGLSTTYSHTFKVPFAWIERQLLLHVGSAAAPYEIVVNGTPAGYNQSSQTAAEFNITEAAREGMNTLEIVLHPDAVSSVLQNVSLRPEITGEVYVVAQPRVRVRDFVSRLTIEGKDAVIELGVLLKTHLLNPKEIMMHYALYSPSGEQVAAGRREREIDMRREDTVRFIVNVADAKLWSPEEPNLYTLVIRTQNENRNWEFVAYQIGIRTVDVEDGRIYVNSRPFPISSATFGARASTEETRKGLTELRAKGVNFIFTERPEPEWFYGLCDREGFFVCPQADIDTRSSGDSRQMGGNPSNDTAWLDSYADRVESMIYIAQSHPSVIAFSLAGQAANGYNLYESYNDAQKKLARNYDTRPIVYFGAGGEWNTDVVTQQTAATLPESVNGRIVFTDRGGKAHPDEAITFAEREPRDGRFAVANNNHFRELSIIVNYVVRQGRRKVSEGSVPVAVGPQSTADISIPYDKASPGKPLAVELSASIPMHGQPPHSQVVTETFSIAY